MQGKPFDLMLERLVVKMQLKQESVKTAFDKIIYFCWTAGQDEADLACIIRQRGFKTERGLQWKINFHKIMYKIEPDTAVVVKVWAGMLVFFNSAISIHPEPTPDAERGIYTGYVLIRVFIVED